ncbi:MAG: hypothetical protein R3D90_17970 [Paracoccaceae bacterium]
MLPSKDPSGFVAATALLDNVQAVEAVMLSQGLRLRVGPHEDDLCPVEELSIGEPVWDLASQRLVDIEAMSCATLDSARLAELGLRAQALPMPGGQGYLALNSTRMMATSPRTQPETGPIVFFRFWPEARLVAEIEGRAVLFRHSLL